MRNTMPSLHNGQKGAALIEYVLILPLVLLLLFGSLELYRVMAVKQLLRTGLKEALPCYNHWKDQAFRSHCDPQSTLRATLRKAEEEGFIHILDYAIYPIPSNLNSVPDGQVFEVIAEAKIALGLFYPLDGPSLTLREKAITFIDSSPDYFDLNLATPFPGDPGALR